MNAVLLCVTRAHDLRLVLLAVLVCGFGAVVTIELTTRIEAARGGLRAGWIAVAAAGAGATVWCTHFVAMLAFEPRAPVALEPLRTLASLTAAIVLIAPGLAVATAGGLAHRLAGGAVVGAAVAGMHYLGMGAYEIQAVLSWDVGLVACSVLLSVGIAALAFAAFGLRHRLWSRVLSAGLLSLAVATLHFVGMAALIIQPTADGAPGLSATTMQVMAIATALAGLLILGCAGVSALIDGHTQADTVRRLDRLARQDALTGLHNRFCFKEQLAHDLARLQPNHRLALIKLNLSRFRSVNGTYGATVGDEVLRAIAARLTTGAPGGSTVSRLGSDEFALIVHHRAAAELEAALARLIAGLGRRLFLTGLSLRPAAAFGVAVAPENGVDAEQLMADVDLALARARKDGMLGEPCFYGLAMDQEERARRTLADQLRAGIGAGQFELHYQVKVSLETGDVEGYEALLRWKHPQHGMVPPGVFVPLAEETGEIVRLGEWTLRRACQEAAAWPRPYRVAVNLSPLQLSDPELGAKVAGALSASGLDSARLELELTESAIIGDRDHALQQLQVLGGMGVSIALDDFGTGYSSLDVLRSFPFERLKLDRSFMAEIENSEQAVAILRAVSTLGRWLGIRVVAEGVETVEHLRIAQREGCTEVQGYLLGRPQRTLVERVHLLEEAREMVDAEARPVPHAA